MAIQDIAREEINAAEAIKKAEAQQQLEQQQRQATAKEQFLKEINQEQLVTQDPETGNNYLGRYAISADMWEMWATAAGYPGARWDDPIAQSKVAGWAAQTMYDEFQNWGLVAIGWRYGMGTARQVRKIYGDTPAGDLIEKMMSKQSAEFIGKVLTVMADAPTGGQQQLMPFMPSGGSRGNIQLQFVPEQPEEVVNERNRGPRASHVLLSKVLGSMADGVAGGRRLSVEELETQVAAIDPEIGETLNIEAKDTEHLGG